jgi:hypothetical protein
VTLGGFSHDPGTLTGNAPGVIGLAVWRTFLAGDESPLSLEDLAEIESRCQAATPGPWQVLSDPQVSCAWLNAASGEDDAAIALFDYRCMDANLANARFAATAREDLPRLAVEVRQLRLRVQQLLDANSKEVDRRSQALRERDEALAKLACLQKVQD